MRPKWLELACLTQEMCTHDTSSYLVFSFLPGDTCNLLKEIFIWVNLLKKIFFSNNTLKVYT